MLQEMLSGYDVIATDSGPKGLEILDRELVDLVICDMLMPVLDGLGTIRRIREKFTDVKIIALSGGGLFGRYDLLGDALETGADGSLQKPVDWEELTTLVARLLDEPGNRATG
jgi:CheY-like chemotaxis protein